MRRATENRELIEIATPVGLIRGTYHRPYNYCMRQDSNRIAVVFVNSMSPTRAANGDSAVYFADSIAELGYPSFRLDLPGFGDSEDDAPPELHDYINRGGYASSASAGMEEITARFNLRGVVIVGHCAGTVSALFTASMSKVCKGLVLMAPYFYLTNVIKAKSAQESRPQVHEAMLPENANLPLLRCWQDVTLRGLPIMILNKPERKSQEMKARSRTFDYLNYVVKIAGQDARITVRLAEGSDHSFSNRLGRVAVRQHVESWLNANFPIKPANYKNVLLRPELEEMNV